MPDNLEDMLPYLSMSNCPDGFGAYTKTGCNTRMSSSGSSYLSDYSFCNSQNHSPRVRIRFPLYDKAFRILSRPE